MKSHHFAAERCRRRAERRRLHADGHTTGNNRIVKFSKDEVRQGWGKTGYARASSARTAIAMDSRPHLRRRPREQLIQLFDQEANS
jgi:hypothetical protein